MIILCGKFEIPSLIRSIVRRKLQNLKTRSRDMDHAPLGHFVFYLLVRAMYNYHVPNLKFHPFQR